MNISTEILQGINQIYANDKKLSKIIDIFGNPDLSKRNDYYNSFLRSIIGQQLSVRAASVIYSRFSNYFMNKPLPEKIISTSDEILRNLGLSWAKIKYVKDLSLKILNSEISFQSLHLKSDEKIIEELTVIKGVGEWTVHMFLIFTLGRLNVLPVSDLGLRRGAMLLYGLKKLPDEKKLRTLSKKFKWEPYNSIASWYIWKSLEIKNIKIK